ncbi:MAG TPA: tripartite tricarboxylate transporter substrate binding protein, partial [Burkholderiales bacterium]|nr:tripartite tricarboxylate transporter substrate binding protein [Burkholderiales bacterium]
GPDKNARVMQKIFQDGKFFSVPVVVATRAGAGSAVSGAYIHRFEGNGHYILMSGKALLTSDVMGRLSFPYTDLTPITHTMDEYIGVAVKADSPIKSGRDLLDRLQKDPAAHSIAIATALGNANHQAVAAALKAAGIDPRKARNVIFNSGGAALTALLGGHVDMVPVSMGLLVGELQSGRVRIIAVSSPNRMTGPFAQVPTWREQGADAVVSVWRGAFGAKGLTPAQIGYWEGIFQKLMATPEWRQEIESAYGVSEFMGSVKTRQYMEREHAAEKAFLTDLGLVKR